MWEFLRNRKGSPKISKGENGCHQLWIMAKKTPEEDAQGRLCSAAKRKVEEVVGRRLDPQTEWCPRTGKIYFQAGAPVGHYERSTATYVWLEEAIAAQPLLAGHLAALKAAVEALP